MKYIISVFLLSFFSMVQCQSFDFPEDWVGNYSGIMLMHYPQANRVDTVNVFFEINEIEPDSSWTYVMSYDSKKYGDIIKEYQIILPNKDNRYLYHLDEKDGIIIEMTHMANTMYSNFSVMGSYLTSRMERVEGGIAFEIVSTKEEPSLQTGIEDPDEPIEVFSYAPFTVQRVFLEEVD